MATSVEPEEEMEERGLFGDEEEEQQQGEQTQTLTQQGWQPACVVGSLSPTVPVHFTRKTGAGVQREIDWKGWVEGGVGGWDPYDFLF